MRTYVRTIGLVITLLSVPVWSPAQGTSARSKVILHRDDEGRIRVIETAMEDGKEVRVSRFDAQGNIKVTNGRLFPFTPRPQRGGYPALQRVAKRVRDRAEALRERVDILFLGDSITQLWPVKSVSERFSSLNAGVGGFQTVNVLDQLRWGLLGKAKPKLVVLHIGTNNNDAQKMSPVETAESIGAILAKIHAEVPKAQVLLIGIIPRGVDSSDVVRKRNEDTNAIIRTFESDPRIHYLDTSQVFVDEQGRGRPELYVDAGSGAFVHLSPRGYRAWNRPVGAAIEKILGVPASGASHGTVQATPSA